MNDTFFEESARYLRDVYLPRLAAALETLPAEDVWWRPHPETVSFGTILSHLEGNVRQWVLSGLGGQPDQRDRASEFSAEVGPDGLTLLARLEATVEQACGVLAGLREQDLERSFTIQGFETTGRSAVYHVVEHFSWHTGQATWIAKARAGAGHGLAFYDEARINAARNE